MSVATGALDPDVMLNSLDDGRDSLSDESLEHEEDDDLEVDELEEDDDELSLLCFFL